MLKFEDERIRRDAQLLDNIKDAARLSMRKGRHPSMAANRPTLYRRLRGYGFPVRVHGKPLPSWRTLTPWMKVQLATFVLSENAYSPFTLHVHDDLRAELLGDGKDLQEELRNRISRHLKSRFGHAPMFFFVMEDSDLHGEPTRPHAHGSIEIPPFALDCDDPKLSRRWRNAVRRVGLDQAELLAGRELVRASLRAAADIAGARPKVALSSGLDQSRNLWLRKPYHTVFNTHWVDYAFKNTIRASKALGDNRLAMTSELIGEARKLWSLIRLGEEALDQWDQPAGIKLP
jgi:hypothetical protein